jgi:hypothetical protein
MPCNLALLLNIGTASFSAAAAFAWWRAAKAPLPWMNWGGVPEIGIAPAANPSEQQAAQECNEGAQAGAKWNKRAAGFACAAALCQVASIISSISS